MGTCIFCGEPTQNPLGFCSEVCYECWQCEQDEIHNIVNTPPAEVEHAPFPEMDENCPW